jgi:hypothetical protein
MLSSSSLKPKITKKRIQGEKGSSQLLLFCTLELTADKLTHYKLMVKKMEIE